MDRQAVRFFVPHFLCFFSHLCGASPFCCRPCFGFAAPLLGSRLRCPGHFTLPLSAICPLSSPLFPTEHFYARDRPRVSRLPPVPPPVSRAPRFPPPPVSRVPVCRPSGGAHPARSRSFPGRPPFPGPRSGPPGPFGPVPARFTPASIPALPPFAASHAFPPPPFPARPLGPPFPAPLLCPPPFPVPTPVSRRLGPVRSCGLLGLRGATWGPPGASWGLLAAPAASCGLLGPPGASW